MRVAVLLAAVAALWVQPASAATFLISGSLTAQGSDADTCRFGQLPGEPPCLPGSAKAVGFSFSVNEGLFGGVSGDGIHYTFTNGSGITSGTINGSFHRTAGDWFAGDLITYNQLSLSFGCGPGPMAANCSYAGATNSFSVVQTDPTPIAPVPEPATWATMLMGLFGLGAVLRRHRQVACATS